MNRLIVKNFGPLKDIDIELNKINLFIGENGSGKSVLAKLITILSKITKAPNYDFLLSELDKYHINFIKDDSFIKKDDIVIKKNKESKIIYTPSIKENSYSENYNLQVKINDNTLNNLQSTLSQMMIKQKEYEKIAKDIKKQFDLYYQKNLNNLTKNQDDFKVITENIKKHLDLYYKKYFNYDYFQYIIAERNLISLFNKSISSMIISEIPIPKFILEFASEYEKAKDEIKELSFLNVRYENSDIDRVYYNKENYLPLEHSSSGIQSAIPMLLTTKYFAKKYRGIVIEEPEQNLFPKAQDEVVKFIIEQVNIEKSNLFLMTHSPYILTSLNNLILANDILQQKGEDTIKGIIDKKSCVAFEDISAYSIENGKAINIMDNENRLIGINIIDSISEEIDETFDKLLGKLDI